MIILPEKFEQSLRHQLGNEFPEFAASFTDAPPVSIRLHPVKGRDGDYPPVPWSRWGRYLPARPVFTLDPLFHAGSFYVQEASSMFLEQAITQAIDPGKRLKVLDLCAAPGGKSTHLLSLLNRDSLLVSNEAIRSRANILSENVQKWGYANCIVTNNDPADFKKLSGFFDVVVIDAPCSGEGLFRKEPDAITEWSPENVQLCAARQRRIVADAWECLKEDGILIYSTCTYNPEENEENLKWLKGQQDVEFLKLKLLPEWNIEEVQESGVTGYRFYPHRTQGEGFFLSVIRKLGATDAVRIKSKKAVARPHKSIQSRLEEWTTRNNESSFFQFNDFVFFTPQTYETEIEFLLQHLKIIYAGTNVASVKHEKLIPEHSLALSLEINRAAFPVIDIDKQDALRYLRRESIQLSGASTGFSLLAYDGLPIGWVNVLSNRVNNMYPSDWRIRMSG